MIRTPLAIALLACSASAFAEIPTWQSTVSRTQVEDRYGITLTPFAKAITVTDDGNIHLDVKTRQSSAYGDSGVGRLGNVVIGAENGYFGERTIESRYMNQDSCGLRHLGTKILKCINDSPVADANDPWSKPIRTLVLEDKIDFQLPGQPPYVDNVWKTQLPEGFTLLDAGFGDNGDVIAIAENGYTSGWGTRPQFFFKIKPDGRIVRDLPAIIPCTSAASLRGIPLATNLFGAPLKEVRRVVDHENVVSVGLCRQQQYPEATTFLTFTSLRASPDAEPVTYQIPLSTDFVPYPDSGMEPTVSITDVVVSIADDGSAYVFYQKDHRIWGMNWNAQTGASQPTALYFYGYDHVDLFDAKIENVSPLGDALGILLKDKAGNHVLTWLDKKDSTQRLENAPFIFLPKDRYPDISSIAFNAKGNAFFLSGAFPAPGAPLVLHVAYRTGERQPPGTVREINWLQDSEHLDTETPPLLAPIGNQGVAVAMTVHPAGNNPQYSEVRVNRYDLQF